jgi:hypothetical protein
MRMLFHLVLGLSIVICWTFQAEAAEANWDSGTIETVSGDYLYINGHKGRHVLELVGDCLWCTEGLGVVIRFQPFLRATVRPAQETVKGRKIRALVVRDGRGDE